MRTLTCTFNQASFGYHLYGYYVWFWLIWLWWLIIDDYHEQARRHRVMLLRHKYKAAD